MSDPGDPRPTINPDLVRCPWCGDDPLYLAYHDEEWGVPVRDDRRLFEKLTLEGAQAGLSWITILRRREGYRRVFAGFDPTVLAGWGEEEIEAALEDEGIIRNRKKVESVVTNARAWLEHFPGRGDLTEFLWGFVNGETKVNAWESMEEVPAVTDQSKAMSKALKAHGFAFVGPTTCYALMQSMGLVDDHLVDCFRHHQASA